MLRVLDDFELFRRKARIGGAEWCFVALILLLRVCSFSYWMRIVLPSARDENRRRIRDNAVDAYCIVQTVILGAVLCWGLRGISWVLLATYILFEIFLSLLNIIFVGKFREIQARPASIERSVILLFVNVLQVVIIFAIFYVHMGLGPVDAFFRSTLVLGTIGFPDLEGPAQLVVALQIFLNLVLGLLLLSTFASQLGFFRRSDLHGSPGTERPDSKQPSDWR